MYRDDKNAMVHQVDSLHREADRLRNDNAAMRDELLAIRRDGGAPQLFNVYATDAAAIPAGQRAALSYHGVTEFPVWATVLLTLFTFGLFPLIHFGLQHDKLPMARANDPSSGKAIGFSFIPYFNLYWIFFSSMRLADRLNLQLRLRGMAPSTGTKGLMIACSVVSVIPYFNLVFALPLWMIGNAFLQRTANRVAALGPMAAPTGEAPPRDPLDPYAAPPAGLLGR